MGFGEAEQDPPKRSMKGNGLSGWGKVGIIAGGGMALFFFAVFMYLNSTGILPAANRLSSARSKYTASGAPQTIADIEKLYVVPDDLNAALILDYLSGTKGTRTRIEFPLAGKKGGERFTVSWKQFVADLDRAASRPNFRPKRDFSNPYSILLPEFSLFRGAMAECFRQAEACVEKGDFAGAEKFVLRAGLIDRWSSDQPFLIAKIVRINGVIDNRRLVGILASLPPGRSEVSRIIAHLKRFADRPVAIEDVAAIEAFSISRLGEIMKEPGNDGLLTSYSSGSSATPTSWLDDQAFAIAGKSPLGEAAISALSTEVGAEFYKEWKKTRDLDKAFDAGGRVLTAFGDGRIVQTMANILPSVSGSGVTKSLNLRPKIQTQLLSIAEWLYAQKSRPSFDVSKLTASDLPANLQFDVLNNPITVVRSGKELRIYSFGVDGTDDMGGSKDAALTIFLGARTQ